jgi:ABC-2 type transport system permease protein
MSGGRVRALAIRIIRGFRRDRRTLALILIVPLVVMALIGYLVGTSGKEALRVTVAFAPALPAEIAEGFRASLEQQPDIEVVDGSATAARRQVADGRSDGAIVVDVSPDGAPRIELIVPGVDVQVESPIVRVAAVAAAEARGDPVAPGTVPGVDVTRVLLPPGTGRPSTISFAAPALITVFAFLFTFMLTSVAFLRERSSGTLDRLLASPVTRADMLLGYLLGFVGFALIQALLVLGYATLVLDARIAGALWLVLLIMVLLVVGSVNLGITLSFYARNELQVIQFIPLVLLPQVFLGGLFWPVATLWPPLRWLSELFPVTHAVHALRAVMLAGQGVAEVWSDLVWLLGFGLAMIGLGALVLGRQRAR